VRKNHDVKKSKGEKVMKAKIGLWTLRETLIKRNFIFVLGGLILTGLLGMASISLAGGDKWTKRADIPTPRWGLSTSAASGQIYAIGGSPNNNAALSTMDEEN
jgi:hypothetical protein